MWRSGTLFESLFKTRVVAMNIALRFAVSFTTRVLFCCTLSLLMLVGLRTSRSAHVYTCFNEILTGNILGQICPTVYFSRTGGFVDWPDK